MLVGKRDVTLITENSTTHLRDTNEATVDSVCVPFLVGDVHVVFESNSRAPLMLLLEMARAKRHHVPICLLGELLERPVTIGVGVRIVSTRRGGILSITWSNAIT